jgi:hypothetical protein
MPLKIELIAIAYGLARYGRLCNNCNHVDKNIMSTICGLHGLETGLGSVCGSWCNDKRPEPIENQIDLFEGVK